MIYRACEHIEHIYTVKLNAFDAIFLLSQAWNKNIVEWTIKKIKINRDALRSKVRSDIQ